MALIAQKFTDNGVQLQLGKISTEVTAAGSVSSVRETQAELSAHLASVFGLRVDLSPIWDRISAAHEQFVSSMPD